MILLVSKEEPDLSAVPRVLFFALLKVDAVFPFLQTFGALSDCCDFS